MNHKKITKDIAQVDKSLVTMFLKMTPEERIRMAASSAMSITEMRNGFEQRKKDDKGN